MTDSKFCAQSVAGALILALGFVLSGWFVQQGLKTFRMSDRVVSVKGLSERDVEADLAVWTLSHTGTGNELTVVQDQIESNGEIIKGFLKEAGFTDEEVLAEPLQAQDLLAQAYRPEGVEQGRYIITQLITVRSNDMAKVDKALANMGSLLRKGVALSNSTPPTYMFTKLNDIKPQMLAEAVKNGRQSAQEFAADSGQKVGGIKNAYQGMFQILPRDPIAYVSEQNQRFKTVRVVSTLDFFLE
jgi:hypothetical protein